jgi:hypothetical protein
MIFFLALLPSLSLVVPSPTERLESVLVNSAMTRAKVSPTISSLCVRERAIRLIKNRVDFLL